ncbi:MAG: alanine dehydrogenase [Pseudomonadales bacterium]|nr:alanine dehydrogenase [Pseudomonadales bacterium]
MKIGVPKELKNQEHRVGLVPGAARELILGGHQVLVETGAGAGIGYSDQHYLEVGAQVCFDVGQLFLEADLIVKVKEPLEAERKKLRAGQILFTYLHLAANQQLTQELVGSGASCIAYETVTSTKGELPLLAPMSEVAGRMSIQAGAYCLEKSHGGAGVLLAGVAGTLPGKVVVIGAGVVGINATQIAAGLGARVVALDRSIERLRVLEHLFPSRVETLFSTTHAIETQVLDADLVIGAVLVSGARAPCLVSEQVVKQMKPGSAIVDVAIDQGGCIETSRPTSHDSPTFIQHGVVHYGVTNMPGAVAKTSSYALNHATLPYIQQLANLGLNEALKQNPGLRDGLNIHQRQVTQQAVAELFDYPFTDTIQLFL